jgi:hypothetical protein
VQIDEDASYVVESSIGMGLPEEEARAIEPATQAALATTLAVSAEAVTITGYDVQGRRLEDDTWTEVGFTVEADGDIVEKVKESVDALAVEHALLSDAISHEVTVQGLESKLSKPVSSLSITVQRSLVREAEQEDSLMNSEGSIGILIYTVSLLAS